MLRVLKFSNNFTFSHFVIKLQTSMYFIGMPCDRATQLRYIVVKNLLF